MVERNKEACLAGGEIKPKSKHIYEWVDEAKQLLKTGQIWELPYEYTSD